MAMASALSLALSACDGRRAGTEVGNPEVKVTAMIAVMDQPGTVEVASLGFRVMGLDYGLAGLTASDSGTCWKRPAGILVDLVQSDTATSTPLADTMVQIRPWTWAHFVLRSPEGPATLPDLADFRTWKNPRYAKFSVIGQGDTLHALFEMPAAMELRLAYKQETVHGWNWGGEIWVPLIFYASAWWGDLDPAGPWETRLDGKHARYVLLSPTENAETWATLKSRLATAFSADTVEVR
jgi:hypothetical protein